jgi:hypothetical protein
VRLKILKPIKNTQSGIQNMRPVFQTTDLFVRNTIKGRGGWRGNIKTKKAHPALIGRGFPPDSTAHPRFIIQKGTSKNWPTDPMTH